MVTSVGRYDPRRALPGYAYTKPQPPTTPSTPTPSTTSTTAPVSNNVPSAFQKQQPFTSSSSSSNKVITSPSTTSPKSNNSGTISNISTNSNIGYSGPTSISTNQPVKQPLTLVPTQVNAQYLETQGQADLLRVGKVEQFSGRSYTDLNPVERSGTAVVTNITPYSNVEVASAFDNKGRNIVLQERQQRQYDIIGSEVSSQVISEVKPKYESMITSSTTPEQLENINKLYQFEVNQKFGERTIEPLSKVNKEFESLARTSKITGYKETGLKVGVGIAATAPLGMLIPAGASTLVGGGFALGGLASASKILKNPSSYSPTIIDLKYVNGKVLGYNTIGGGQLTGEASVGLGLSLAPVALFGATSLATARREMFLSEVEGITARSIAGLKAPTFEMRYSGQGADLSIIGAKSGKFMPGSAQSDYFAVGMTTKGTSPVYGQSGVISTRGAVYDPLNIYPKRWGGSDFNVVQNFQTSGKIMNLPSTTSESFGLVMPGKTYIGGVTQLGTKTNTFSYTQEPSAITLGRYTPIKDDFGVSRTYNINKLAFDTNAKSWAVQTSGLKNMGFVNIKYPSGGNIGSGGIITIQKGNAGMFGGESIISQVSTSAKSFNLPKITTKPVSFDVMGTGTSNVLKGLQTSTATSSTVMQNLKQLPTSVTSTKSRSLQVSSFNIPQSLASTTYRLRTSTATTQLSSQLNIPSLQQKTLLATVPALTSMGASMGGFGLAAGFLPPVFPTMDINFGFGARKFGAKARRKYTPSYSALIFNIKGKAPKGVYKGGIRPITKGFKWSFN